MQVKRFRAPSLREALQDVKKSLGEDAVILKTEQLSRAGMFDMMNPDQFEVVAAVDVPLSKDRPKSSPADIYARNQGLGSENRSPEAERMDFSGYLQRSMVGSTPSFSRGKARPSPTGSAPQKSRAMPTRKETDGKSSRGNSEMPRHAKTRSLDPSRRDVGASEPAREPWARDESVESLRSEVRELRALVSSLAQPFRIDGGLNVKEFADMPSSLAREMMALMEYGIEKGVAKAIIQKMASSALPNDMERKDELHQRVMQTMSGMIRTSGPIQCTKGKAKVVAFVGPTGVGKTTTLAKLAANSKFVFDKSVSLISADTYRMSAVEHLNTFAGIAQLPISAVYNPEELRAALTAHRDKDLIFIDTAGRSPKDDRHLDELKTFMECANPDEIHLVLPVHLRSEDLLEIIRRYRSLAVNRIVVSKIDETDLLGGIMNIAAEVESPLSYITNGQTIPDDITLANSRTLARMITRAA
jgi:flagellar biosynthesis protein FlhF